MDVPLTSATVLPACTLKMVLFPIEVLVEAFLYLVPEAATVSVIHSAIRDTMLSWGNELKEIPSLLDVASTLFSMITKSVLVECQPNPAPPHDAVYVMSKDLRDCFNEVLLRPFSDVLESNGVDSVARLFLPVVIIHAVLFKHMVVN
jgi:hypothetical protein